MADTISLMKRVPSTPNTPRSHPPASQHRLLYRGALSVPDSYMLLDGLSFVAETRSAVQDSPAANLFSNPLALALESMRGRPSLHLLGTERLEDVWLDAKSNISVYVHPYSTLSLLYFRNILCLHEITSAEQRTAVGVRVSLTEQSDPEMSDFLIYGQLVPIPAAAPSSSTAEPTVLQMYAARILPGPPPPVVRPPRPDDPTPRKPPAHIIKSGSKRKRDAAGATLVSGQGIKRTKSGITPEENELVKLAREVMLRGPQVPSRGKPEADVFKVPPLPLRAGSRDSSDLASQASDDVFGSVASVNGKGKGKGKGKEIIESSGSSELEKANKIVIKQATVSSLAKHGVKKGDGEFQELYSIISRGVTFALRTIMRTQAVNMRVVDRLLEAHVRMYLNGNGENHILSCQDPQS